MPLRPGDTDARQDFYDPPQYSDAHTIHELEGRCTQLLSSLDAKDEVIRHQAARIAQLQAELDKALALLGVKRHAANAAQRLGVV